ncbi:hypothetical protein [Desulfitobacterium sp.]|uniref:hypothetical protein n=1 Tax=Desulfitobacterium sp. TaxID=49981 RepID=UPI002B1F3FF2|nr:hypothetical protein [Desulfitobacterium sp.]MEA4902924.1 hypothetical protein [Desulfitobacterium sp.]
MKKLFIVILVAFMLIGTQSALGATPQVNEMGIVTPNAYQAIASGQCKIVNIGGGTINISGRTTTYYPVKQIGLKLYLQYLSNGQWYTIDSYSYYEYDSSLVSGGELLEVSSGYYYRVFAQYTALDGTISESGQSFTEAIYVS